MAPTVPPMVLRRSARLASAKPPIQGISRITKASKPSRRKSTKTKSAKAIGPTKLEATNGMVPPASFEVRQQDQRLAIHNASAADPNDAKYTVHTKPIAERISYASLPLELRQMISRKVIVDAYTEIKEVLEHRPLWPLGGAHEVDPTAMPSYWTQVEDFASAFGRTDALYGLTALEQEILGDINQSLQQARIITKEEEEELLERTRRIGYMPFRHDVLLARKSITHRAMVDDFYSVMHAEAVKVMKRCSV